MSPSRVFPLAVLLAAGAVAACASAFPGGFRQKVEGGPELFVTLRGNHSPSVVVLGASWLADDLDGLASARGVLFYDPRGRGRSTPIGDLSAMSMAHDVADLESLRERRGIPRMTLVGWAYNAGVCVRYALEYPENVSGLVLIAPLPPRRDPYWPQYVERFAARADPAAFKKLAELRVRGAGQSDPRAYCLAVTEAFVATCVADPEGVRDMRSDPCVPPNMDPDVTSAQGQALIDALGAWDWTAELATLEAPTLLVQGTEDLIPPGVSEAYAAALPNARVVLLQGVGHMPWLEDPVAFLAQANAFLAEIPRAPFGG